METRKARDDGRGTGGAVASAGSSEESQIVAALEEYVELRRAGNAPPREQFLRERPAIAEGLAACLEGLELLESAESGFTPAEPEAAAPPPARLGDFHLVRELGRGGMGVVYEAEQVSLGRRVALKVLPFAAALDPRRRQRFQLEAQAAAHLHHPHIVPVYAVGCDSGVHYYAMQYVDGRTLSAVIRELRRDRTEKAAKRTGDSSSESKSGLIDASASGGLAAGRGRSYQRTVAELGRQAAEALDHAHRLGVVHRDVKPGNLMIDGAGKLWVTDFGLARLGDEVDGLTRTGDVVGTLRYTSPEQALATRAIIDQRTDVYSLGATLYELLTLRPPFDGRDRATLLSQLAGAEPPAPRKLDPSIPRDLETILLKALAKEPEGRYGSARELADDLGRFLADQPIRARRPGPAERAMKWTRRHRNVVAASLAVLFLVGGIGTGLLLREQSRTRAALLKEQEARKRELRILGSMFAMADGISMRAMGELANAAGKMGDGPTQVDPKGLYGTALDFYEKIADLVGPDPERRPMLALTLQRIGFCRMLLGRPGALDAFARSGEIYEALLAESPDNGQLLQEAGDTYQYKVRMMGSGGARLDRDGLLRALHRELDLRRELERRQPRSIAAFISAYKTRVAASRTLRRMGRSAEADTLRKELIEEIPAAAGKLRMIHPMNRDAFAGSVREFGDELANSGRRDDAERMLRVARQVVPDAPDIANNLAWLLCARPELKPYDPKEAVALAEQAVKHEPPQRAWLNTYGTALYRAGRPREAVEVLRKAVRIPTNIDAYVAFDNFVLSLAHHSLGEEAAGRACYATAVKAAAKAAPDPDLKAIASEAARYYGDVAAK